ncbi:hypothetical protein D9619_011294 [Psilocybe cf. subviscida]|uniref:Uncharacterized protein n=1 Tax=Psilocybe cf. subviscida TaxID=2480587 RepID=A0A8H5F5U2_9AGAR|nr:hypothetical protein D9619_011294 [Psilocybe cf. subviscida]
MTLGSADTEIDEQDSRQNEGVAGIVFDEARDDGFGAQGCVTAVATSDLMKEMQVYDSRDARESKKPSARLDSDSLRFFKQSLGTSDPHIMQEAENPEECRPTERLIALGYSGALLLPPVGKVADDDVMTVDAGMVWAARPIDFTAGSKLLAILFATDGGTNELDADTGITRLLRCVRFSLGLATTATITPSISLPVTFPGTYSILLQTQSPQRPRLTLPSCVEVSSELASRPSHRLLLLSDLRVVVMHASDPSAHAHHVIPQTFARRLPSLCMDLRSTFRKIFLQQLPPGKCTSPFPIVDIRDDLSVPPSPVPCSTDSRSTSTLCDENPASANGQSLRSLVNWSEHRAEARMAQMARIIRGLGTLAAPASTPAS